jgi:hypothetical protein
MRLHCAMIIFEMLVNYNYILPMAHNCKYMNASIYYYLENSLLNYLHSELYYVLES